MRPESMRVHAPARVFDEPSEVHEAFERGELFRDMCLVLRSQGPRANGMPEHHKIISYLAICQSKGYSVALLSDGRLSGASASVLAAIHLSPEAALGGGVSKLRDGDLILIDALAGQLEVFVDETCWQNRQSQYKLSPEIGTGRELFSGLRRIVGRSDEGACTGLSDTTVGT